MTANFLRHVLLQEFAYQGRLYAGMIFVTLTKARIDAPARQTAPLLEILLPAALAEITMTALMGRIVTLMGDAETPAQIRAAANALRHAMG